MSIGRKDDGLTGLSDSMRRQGSAEQLADKVLERIISGQIRPGTSLREAALAEAGGISRNTARETIRILVAGGLVQHFPQRGAVVCELGASDIRDIYRLRLMMELAGADAADQMTAAQGARLRDAVQNFESAASSGDWRDLVDADLAFHSRIVELAGSPRLNRFYSSIANEVRFGFAVVSVMDGEVENPGPLVAEHRNIYQLIVDGDTAACTELLTAHLHRFGNRLYEVFRQRDAESAREDLVPEELHSA